MFSLVAIMIIASVVSIALALYLGTVIGAARAEGVPACAALRYEARLLRREVAAAARAAIDSGRRIIVSRAARRLDAARRRSAAVTFEQALAACVLADAGVLPERAIRRPIRRRPILRAAAMAAGAAAAAMLLAAPLVSTLAGADVRAAAASIVRQ